MKAKKTPYLTSTDLAEELRKSKQQNAPTVKACEYFRLIAAHLLGDSRYRRYPKDLQEDMISAALVKSIKNIHNFKEQYADCCFNYWTRLTEHAFWEVLKKYYKHVNLQRELILNYAEHIEHISPALAQQLKDAQIVVEYTKDKLTFKGKKQ